MPILLLLLCCDVIACCAAGTNPTGTAHFTSVAHTSHNIDNDNIDGAVRCDDDGATATTAAIAHIRHP